MVYWIAGKSKSGKTTLAKKIANELNAIVLDGDDFRTYFPAGFSNQERFEHIMRMAKTAALIEKQGFTVIVACVSPKKEWRQKAQSLFKECKEIILLGGEPMWDGLEFEA